MRLEELMENRSVFVSSCSRRELARRRPTRMAPWAPILLSLLVVVLAMGVFAAARGGI
jgi:hypothetical protein